MKILLTFLLFLFSFAPLVAQENFPIKISDFSDQYEARIELNQTERAITENDFDGIPPYLIKVFRENFRQSFD